MIAEKEMAAAASPLDFCLLNAQPLIDQLRFEGTKLDLTRIREVFPDGVIQDANGRLLNIHVIHLLNLALKNIQELNAKVHDLEMQLLLK